MRRPAPELRPLSVPEALDAALLMLCGGAGRYYALSLPGSLPVAALVLGYYSWISTLPKSRAGEYWSGTLAWAVAMAAAWLLLSVSRGALAAAMLGDARGEPRTAGDCWRLAFRRGPTLALVGAVATAGAWFAGLAAVVGGLFAFSAWMVAACVAVDEDRDYLAALERSAALTRGYRARCLRLWALLLLFTLVVAGNLYAGVQMLLGLLNTLLGVDFSRWVEACSYRNHAYLVGLFLFLFLLLEPLKSCVDTALYLDLRIRREGADLQARLRSLTVAAALLVLLLFPRGAAADAPAAPLSLDQYQQKVQELRRETAAGQPDPELRRSLAVVTLRMPDGQQRTIRNRWIAGPTGSPAEEEQLAARLEALSRELAPPAAPAPPRVSPEQAYRSAMARPEFQELADRPELRDLTRGVHAPKVGTWISRLGTWIRRYLLHTADPKLHAPDLSGYHWSERIGRLVLYGLLALAGAVLTGLLARALFLRLTERGSKKPVPAAAAGLDESQTENALDHTPDQWETFAAEWLRRGDLRQAVRALYLALLVDLHQQRLIDYNRAHTNWQYVRRFAGAPEQGEVLRTLTERFDLTWYGRRSCSPEQYDAFAAGVRSLATGQPGGGLARA